MGAVLLVEEGGVPEENHKPSIDRLIILVKKSECTHTLLITAVEQLRPLGHRGPYNKS